MFDLGMSQRQARLGLAEAKAAGVVQSDGNGEFTWTSMPPRTWREIQGGHQAARSHPRRPIMWKYEITLQVLENGQLWRGELVNLKTGIFVGEREADDHEQVLDALHEDLKLAIARC